MAGTDIVFVMDRSGSMKNPIGMPETAVKGYNEFLDIQSRKLDDDPRLSLVMFNQKLNSWNCFRAPLHNAPDLKQTDFEPMGGTALNDAIIKSATTIENAVEREGPRLKILLVLTDGGENESTSSDQEAFRQLDKLRCNGWKTIYLTSNETEGRSHAQQLGFKDKDISCQAHTTKGKLQNYRDGCNQCMAYRQAATP